MAKLKVFVGNDYKILYIGRGLERPTLIGYVYEYEVEEIDVKYWNSLRNEEKENMLGEAQRGKTDIRLLLRKKRREPN